MKLIIQIPCFNEEKTLPATLADLPREVPGFDSVEWLVIDDGSTDRTVDVARANGVDHIVRLTNNKGLANGFQAGLDAALKLGADVIVNTDADNQYYGPDVAQARRADRRRQRRHGRRRPPGDDDRRLLALEEVAPAARLVGRAPGVADDLARHHVGLPRLQPRGRAALQVVSKFTYTLETIIQAGKMTVAVDHVPIRTNAKTRESRLFPSMWSYVRRNSVSIFRIYSMYEPLRVFMTAAVLVGVLAHGRVDALLRRLRAGRRRGPRAVADPRRRAVQRRRRARRRSA